MSEIFDIDPEEIKPNEELILVKQGVPPGAIPSEGIADVLEKALSSYSEMAEPKGMYAEISARDFKLVYKGEGRNEAETPLELIYPRASHLALFAATIGEAISKKISELFDNRELALAIMLDAVASEAADDAADYTNSRFLNKLQRTGLAGTTAKSLAYSPGYCGWHVSGQGKLFEYLHPERIGITLNSSFLMQPLKSVSGVLVAGDAMIHDFEDHYPFCSTCEDHQCRKRIHSVLGH